MKALEIARSKQQWTSAFMVACLSSLSLFSTALAADPVQTTTDESVSKAIAKLESISQKAIDDNTVAGLAVGVVFNDKVVYVKGFGLRDSRTTQKIDGDTVFQLASLSKPISSSILAKVIGEDKMTWDSKIIDMDGSFQMSVPFISSEITLRDFFCHRSGLPEHTGDLLEDIGYDRSTILHRLRYQKPNTSFRSGYAYTNFGLTEAGEAAAKKCGMRWEELADQKLFQPLHMTSTSMRHSDFIARPNKALGHVLVNGKWTQKWDRDADAQAPAGGVTSSVNDMTQWMRLQLGNGKIDGKQLVAEAPIVETHVPQMRTGFSPIDGLPGFYGLGMNVNYDTSGRLRFGHSGAFAMGAATCVNFVPSEKLGIVVLTNSNPIGFAEGLAYTFMDDAIEGKQRVDWIKLFHQVFQNPATFGLTAGFDFSKPPSVKTPALAKAAYIGEYAEDFFGDISIIEKNGGLAIVLGPNKLTIPMTHYDRDIYTYETVGENATGLSGISFLIGKDGKATQISIDNFNVHSPHLFTRKSSTVTASH